MGSRGQTVMIIQKFKLCQLCKKELRQITITNCILHRYALASKTLAENFKKILFMAISVANYIKGRALNNRIFRAFCEEIDTSHAVLLYHTKVRWLSKGHLLSRVCEMQSEII